jgi:hypothetical protein
MQLSEPKEVQTKNAENQMSAKPEETTTRSLTYVPLASCVVAVLSIAAWPLFNTFLSIGLAVTAFVLGIMGLVVARRSPTTSRYVCSAVGIVLSAAVILCWIGIMFLSWSAATGRPL